MSESANDPRKAGPALTSSVEEVRGTFPSDAALNDAIARLQSAGFDRADISIPDLSAPRSMQTPEQGADNPNAEDDTRQARTLHTSMAASVGAMAAAGIVIATGGAALPAVAAAVAGGLGLGGAVQGITAASDQVQHDSRQEAADRGELVLSVRIRDDTGQGRAEQALRDGGALTLTVVTRDHAGATPPTA